MLKLKDYKQMEVGRVYLYEGHFHMVWKDDKLFVHYLGEKMFYPFDDFDIWLKNWGESEIKETDILI